MSRTRKILTTTAKFAVAALLIAWIVKRGGLDLNSLKIALSPVPFFILGGLVLGQLLLNNWRWLLLLRGQGMAATTRQTFPLTLIGLFFNYAMPGSVGGDLIKGYYLTRDFPEQKLAAGVSVFMDRLIGFFVMMLSASLAIIAFSDRLEHDKRLMTIGTGTLLITLAFILILAFSLSRRLQGPLRFVAGILLELSNRKFLSRKFFKTIYRMLHDIYHAMHSYRARLSDLVWALVLSMFNQVLLIGYFYYVAQLLGETGIPISAFWFCIPVGLVVQSVPIAPAGVGVGQAIFFFLFEATLQQPTQVGAVGITLLQVLQFLLGLIGAFFYLKRGGAAGAAVAKAVATDASLEGSGNARSN